MKTASSLTRTFQALQYSDRAIPAASRRRKTEAAGQLTEPNVLYRDGLIQAVLPLRVLRDPGESLDFF